LKEVLEGRATARPINLRNTADAPLGVPTENET